STQESSLSLASSRFPPIQQTHSHELILTCFSKRHIPEPSRKYAVHTHQLLQLATFDALIRSNCKKLSVTELLRHGIRQLERYRHPRLLQVVAGPEDTPETLSFYSEPVMASLANIITPADEKEKEKGTGVSKDYNFLEIELKYGILQLTEALSFLHYSCHVIHRNVTPASVFVTKRGTWKLAGLEFTEKVAEGEGHDTITVQSWTSRVPKMTQPDLDFIAPEVQTSSSCSVVSDMFSLGMCVCAIFNSGKSLIEANHSSSLYQKQLDVQAKKYCKLVISRLSAKRSQMRQGKLNIKGKFSRAEFSYSPDRICRFVNTIPLLLSGMFLVALTRYNVSVIRSLGLPSEQGHRKNGEEPE
ncbi:SCY1-like protein 2, partial [Penaeus japonicus]|uniref:SCY1-like protein 2 n=1 Tax=Penaeus japonicus TaxID=27405 RepID=UPI001C70B99C